MSLRLVGLSWTVALVLSASGCGGSNLWTACSGEADCPAGQRCVAGRCEAAPGEDGGLPDADTPEGPECVVHADCGGGVCLGGECCPSEDQVCGTSCCRAGETCFAQACVVPGRLCHAEADCDEGQYCEVALGEIGDTGGDPGGEGGTCLFPTPSSGRCLDLPPRCLPGESPEDGRGCMPECEYRPPPGALDAVMRWRWGPTATELPGFTDVWATPAVGRVADTNCDGSVDELDPPNVIFVSGNARGTCCQCTDREISACQDGVLRVLDGLTGREVWSLRRAFAASTGFSGASVAIGHLVDEGGLDGRATTVDVAALTGEGRLAIIGSTGEVLAVSAEAIGGASSASFGWGGGLAIGDMDGDGSPEVAFGATVFTVAGGEVSLRFVGEAGTSGPVSQMLSYFVDLDGAPDGHLELMAGNTAYEADGSVLWQRADLGDGITGVGDFDLDGAPEVVLVDGGQVLLLEGATGATLLGPTTLPSDGSGGAPTVADFDGDGLPEIGVAQKSFYAMLDVEVRRAEVSTEWIALEVAWQTPNHDLSSSVTGSTVFDFEGDGAAEVVYNDECFLWVYDGRTGDVRFATPTNSFTGTEASLVADVDGDGHAEMLMISNGADPSESGWGCDVAPWNAPDPEGVRPAWAPPPGETAWRGIALWGDRASSWVGTRTLWNQHAYSVSNVCDHRDDACLAPNVYGGIPTDQLDNWTVPWLNNFRQNVQDEGIYDAPDATVTLAVACTEPPRLTAYVRNLGAAVLPAGVEVAFVAEDGAAVETDLGRGRTRTALYPGQVGEVELTPAGDAGVTLETRFRARVLFDPEAPLFRQCRDDNDESPLVTATCLD